MKEKKNIYAIIGSASQNSANQKLVENFVASTAADFNWTLLTDLKVFPHFDPERSIDDTPHQIVAFRNEIEKADGVLICTPEYIFSIPSGLKNLIEWIVSTTVFSDKPTAIITASASGQKGHDELQLLLKTVMAKCSDATTLLIPGIKGKINEQGQITDPKTNDDLKAFASAFKNLVSGTN